MKILGAMFLLVGICLVAIIGVVALQSQIDTGDSVITEFSDNYETYETVKDTTALTATTISYVPYFMMFILIACLGVLGMSTAVYLKHKF